MTITRLTTPPGITSTKVINVPDQWSSAWFRNFIKIWLQNQNVGGDVEQLTAGSAAFILGSDGSLTVDTSEGTAGYVLTSQGPGQPAHWAPGGGGGGSGTVTSVALSDGSTTPIYTISGSPVTVSGTLAFTLATQAANKIFAGPTTGSAAQPTFRSLVVADIPSGYPYSSLSGAPSIPVGANPSASVGLSAVNGSAATFMTSDSAPALSQGIAPTWTGQHTFTPSGSNPGLIVNAPSGNYAAEFIGNAASGLSDGILIQAGSTAADGPLVIRNKAATQQFLYIFGDGGITAGSTGLTDEGLGTVNVSGGFYVNGVLIGSGSGTGANVQVFTQAGGTTQTWTKPVGSFAIRVYCIGGGGGGGSGAVQASGSACSGGAGGGGGGISVWDFESSALGTTVTITFGSTTGGTGGTSVAASGGAHAGTTGTAGTFAEFGAAGAGLLVAYGGQAGGGGALASASSAGAGGNGLQQTGLAAGAGVSGGAGGGGSNSTNVAGVTAFPMAGGGAGGGISTTPAAFAGGNGGGPNGSTPFYNLSVGAAGTASGGVGGNGSSFGGWGPASGGGGGGSGITTVSGGKGGNGGGFGAGGGGGGSCLTTATSGVAGSGAGGNGGSAAVIVISW